jgi:hypothetical protein
LEIIFEKMKIITDGHEAIKKEGSNAREENLNNKKVSKNN